MKDGYSSLARYYYNNLHDGKRQVWFTSTTLTLMVVVNFDFKIRSDSNSASTTFTLQNIVYFFAKKLTDRPYVWVVFTFRLYRMLLTLLLDTIHWTEDSLFERKEKSQRFSL